MNESAAFAAGARGTDLAFAQRAMRALSLLLLRTTTGLLLIVWGIVRLGAPEMGAHVSDKYYGGLGNSQNAVR